MYIKSGRINAVLIDLFILSAFFGLFLWLKPATLRHYVPHFSEPYLYFTLLWVGVSFVTGKYTILAKKEIEKVLFPIVASSAISIAAVSVAMYSFQNTSYSRMVVLGTILAATVIEIFLANLYYFHTFKNEFAKIADTRAIVLPAWVSSDVLKNAIVLKTSSWVTVASLPYKYERIINSERLNRVRNINSLLESVNERLVDGGVYIGCVETIEQRVFRLLSKFTPAFISLVYVADFLFHRVLPKIGITSKSYFAVTRGYANVLSKAETFGRLCYCGFEIADEWEIDGLLYFSAKKIKEPSRLPNPTYGPLIALRRVGKDGKLIKVYKMRTMHPYSEFLQEYVFNKYNLKEGGKFQNDFRITALGRLMRKLFLDEFPMFINFFKGELKLVGVRPLSQHYFNLYTKELQEKRIKTKPGLVPPFYVDRPETLEEIMESEMRYLEAYERSPLVTDLRYFVGAVVNIVFRRARSS